MQNPESLRALLLERDLGRAVVALPAPSEAPAVGMVVLGDTTAETPFVHGIMPSDWCRDFLA